MMEELSLLSLGEGFTVLSPHGPKLSFCLVLRRLDDQRHRAVVDQVHLHHGPEAPGGNGHAAAAHPFDKLLIELVRLFRRRRAFEARPK